GRGRNAVNIREIDDGLSLPTYKRRAPSETAAHRLKQNEVIALYAAIVNSCNQRQGNRRGGGIRMLCDGGDHTRWVHADLTCGCIEDALVCLVGNEPVDIGGREVV